MAVETRDVKTLVNNQRAAIAAFFGVEVPVPTDRLFIVCDKIRQEKLWTPEPLYIPGYRLSEGQSFPGLEHPLSSVLYRWVRDGLVDAGANVLPGQWIIWDPTKRPNYNNGKQMYPDTRRFKELLAGLRERTDGIEVPDYLRHVPQDSRFGISADEIDGNRNIVAGEIARILGLQEGEVVSAPPYANFNYVGNLRHPELGGADTSEWLGDYFGRGLRLCGGDTLFGGLSGVSDWLSGYRYVSIGFRLQVSFLS